MKVSSGTFRNLVFFGITAGIVITCFIVNAIFFGFEHEPQRFSGILVTMIFVLVFHFAFWDPIRHIVLAIDHATWPAADLPYTADKEVYKASHITYLKARLRGLRSELKITEDHKNENLNRKYKHISSDLLLYGSYFLTLMLAISVTQDQTLYYASDMIYRLFNENTSTTMGLSQIYIQYEISSFLKLTMIEGFHAESSVYGHDGWWAMEQWKRMGTVRLRQVRSEDRHIGLGTPKWANTTYAPEWQLPYKRMHYTDKFWRIFYPFQPIAVEPGFLDGLLLNFNHRGDLMNYPELNGYMALLMVTLWDSLKQAEYLRDYQWLDKNTWALFIDFTMYNVDADVFTMVTLRVENTPFGGQLPKVDVHCINITMDTFSILEFTVLALYIILVMQFMRGLLTKVWYDPAVIKELWNFVDLIICLLNIFLVTLSIMLRIVSKEILSKIETTTQAQYLEIQRPLRLHHLITIIKGFLVCITTMRLWKVLQFASVFQHFAQTLYSAWKAVLSLGVIIMVFLFGIGIALAVPNGNNAAVFRHVIQAVITCLWYSVGFNNGITPKEFFHGGVYMGMFLYLLLVGILAVLLMNVFASVIYDYLKTTGRALKEQKRGDHITFLQFLWVEYESVLRRCLCCIWNQRKKYHHRRRTVSENVTLELNHRELEKMRRARYRAEDVIVLTDEEQHADYLRRVEHTFSVLALLTVQIELLDRLLLGDEFGNLPTPPSSDQESD